MILHGNQRGGAKDLALHLIKEENEHVEVHELRGFISGNLVSALKEIHAVSRGTKARQFLFSLSLNPPPAENVSTEVFEDAIERIENLIGLLDQYRHKLEDPGITLKNIDPIIQEIDQETENLAPALDSLPEDDELNKLLNQTLVTASLEVTKFYRGDYIAP